MQMVHGVTNGVSYPMVQSVKFTRDPIRKSPLFFFLFRTRRKEVFFV